MNNQYIKLPNSDVFLEDDDPDTLDYLEMVKNRNRIELNTPEILLVREFK